MKKKILLVLITALLCAGLIMSCGDDAPTKYTVTFDKGFTGADTVTGMPGEQSVVKGDKVTKPTADPARTGFAFDGWRTAANGGGNLWNFTTGTVNAALTLYASWGKITDLGEFTWINGTAGQQKGWRTDGTDGEDTDLNITDLINAKYLKLVLTSKPDNTMQIVWQGSANTDWNQTAIISSGVIDATKGVVWDEATKTLTIELSKALDNYADLENCTTAKIMVAYYGAGGIDALITDACLVADPAAVPFVFITFDANGGAWVNGDEERTVMIRKGTVMGAKFASNPIKADHRLNGWADEGGTAYTRTTAINADVTLKAQWVEGTPDNVVVTFNTDGGSAAPAPIEIPEGTSIGGDSFPANPTKAGFVFAGWYNGSTKIDSDTAIDESITVTARWEEIVYPEPATPLTELTRFLYPPTVITIDGGNSLAAWATGKGNITGTSLAAIKAADPGSVLLVYSSCSVAGKGGYGMGTIGGVTYNNPGAYNLNQIYTFKINVKDIANLATATSLTVNPYDGASDGSKIHLLELWAPDPAAPSTPFPVVATLGVEYDMMGGKGSDDPTQLGFNFGSYLNKIATSKYLIIETVGEGDNESGFGGLDIAYQGGGTASVSWTQTTIVKDGWITFPRADGKTAYIVINLEDMFDDKYDDIQNCTTWAQLYICYYGGDDAFDGLGAVNVYLAGDFTKPTSDFKDLNSDLGFIFNP